VRADTLVLLTLLYAAVPCLPAHAQANLAKCACHTVDENSTEDKDGSRAVNATLCIQEFDPNRHWCEVTIECLRERIGPDCSGMPKDSQGLVTLFKTHIQYLTSNPSKIGKEMIAQSDKTLGVIYSASKYDESIYSKCFYALQDKKEVSLKGENGLNCMVTVTNEGTAAVRIDATPYITYMHS
jgi:hypothetical protein